MSKLYRLENDYLRLDISPQASEWHTLIDKRTGIDYAYKGDPAWWTGRNPTLFPFVGKLNGGKFTYQSQDYPHSNHGFARTSTFSVINAAPDHSSIQLAFQDSDDTRRIYPFHFTLTNSYAITANRLQVTTNVCNQGDRPLPCTLGAHPAFALHLDTGTSLGDYQLIFDGQQEFTKRRLMNPDGSWQKEFVTWDPPRLSDQTDGRTHISLDEHMFDQDVVALWDLQSASVTLQGKNPAERVKLHRGNSKILGIWAKPGAPFICLEPWLGYGDLEGWSGEIMTRPETAIVQPGQNYTLTYSLEIGEPALDN